MSDTAAPTYRVLGTTDDVTECGRCGKAELCGTVVIAWLDADGDQDGVDYWGATCAARYLGTTTTDVRTAAQRANRAAEQARRDAEAAEREAQRAEENRRFTAWLLDTYGTADRDAVRDRCGDRTYVHMWRDFYATR